MLKIKDKSKFNEIVKKYNMEYDADNDYESGWSYACYYKNGVVFDVSNWYEDAKDSDYDIFIYGKDDESLDILYDLIKANLVEKAGEIE